MQYYTDKDEKDVETSIKSGFISFMSKNHVQIFFLALEIYYYFRLSSQLTSPFPSHIQTPMVSNIQSPRTKPKFQDFVSGRVS